MSPVTRTVLAFPAMLRVGFQLSLAYRAEFVIWILTSTMPLIMLALWDAVAIGGPVEGFGQAEFTRYFTVTLVARQLTSAWVVWELAEEIRTGRLSPKLLRPVNPIFQHAGENLAAMPMRLLVLVPLVAALVGWRPEMGLDITPTRVGVFLVSCALAWIMAFGWQAIFGAFSFWFDRSDGLFMVWFGFWSILAGYLIPLPLLPEWLQAVGVWLPFRAMLAIPVEIGAGLLPAEAWLEALAVQIGWCVATVSLCGFVWRRGVGRYGAFGA